MLHLMFFSSKNETLIKNVKEKIKYKNDIIQSIYDSPNNIEGVKKLIQCYLKELEIEDLCLSIDIHNQITYDENNGLIINEDFKMLHRYAKYFLDKKLYGHTFELLTVSAEKGYANALYSLGIMFEYGFGNMYAQYYDETICNNIFHEEESNEPNVYGSTFFYKKAAAKGNYDAILALKRIGDEYPDLVEFTVL